MAEGFKIADAYVEIDAEIDEAGIRRKSKGAGEKAGRDMGRELGDNAGRTLGGVLSGHLPTIFSSPYVLAAAGVAGVALGPALGAGIAAGITGGAGLGAIAAGIALIADRPEIKKGATALKNRFMDIDTSDLEAKVLAAQERLASARKSKNKDAIKEAKADLATLQRDLNRAQAFNEKNFSLKDAARPLIQPVLEAMNMFGQAASRIIPKLGKMFAQLDSSGAIPALAAGLIALVEKALPGMLELVAASGPFLTQIAPALGIIGEGLGTFASQIAAVSPEAAVFFMDLARFLAGQIAMWGLIIATLTKVYSSMRGFFTSIPGWVSGAVGFFQNLWTAITTRGGTVMAWFQALPGRIGAAIAALPGRVRAVFWRMFDMVTTGIGTFIGTVIRLAITLPGKMAIAIVSLPGRIVAVIASMRSRSQSAISAFISGAISTLRTLPGRAASALSGFASAVAGRLQAAVSSAYSIGQDIIRGIISGIGSMVGAAAAAAARAAKNIVAGAKSALGIGSPSKVMADEVGRWILPGVTAGVAASLPAARREVAGMTGALVPGVRAPGGLAREGAGTSAGGTSYYFAPGSIVIDASKLKDINDLLAMIGGMKRSARAMRPRSAMTGA
jgi:hypothetical protein